MSMAPVALTGEQALEGAVVGLVEDPGVLGRVHRRCGRPGVSASLHWGREESYITTHAEQCDTRKCSGDKHWRLVALGCSGCKLHTT